MNITASEDSLRLDETTTIIEHIQEAAGDNADIIFGTVYDPAMEDKLSVTVIATGFQAAQRNSENLKRTNLDSPVEQSKPSKEFTLFSPNLSLESFPEPELKPEIPVVSKSKERKDVPQKREAPETELEERMRKLRSTDYNYHDTEKLKNLEDMPAYLRKNLNLEEPNTVPENKKLSRVTIDEVYENKYELSDNNSFLHDNVD